MSDTVDAQCSLGYTQAPLLVPETMAGAASLYKCFSLCTMVRLSLFKVESGGGACNFPLPFAVGSFRSDRLSSAKLSLLFGSAAGRGRT